MYEVVLVRRAPQMSGPPVLTEVDPIRFNSLAWSEHLDDDGTIDLGLTPTAQTSAVKALLSGEEYTTEQGRTRRVIPAEVHVWRAERLVAAGPVWAVSGQGDTVTVNAQGLRGYLRYMHVRTDLTYTGVDQYAIARGLVSQWQSQPYGHYGIVLGAETSGVTRSATYTAAERHNVHDRVTELGARRNGFDVWVDPATRELRLGERGTDLSDVVVFDRRNITDVSWSTAQSPGSIASVALGVGDGDPPITTTTVHVELRQAFGLAGVTDTFDRVSVQATLDAHTGRLLDLADGLAVSPATGLIAVADADPTTFGPGDVVGYEQDTGLGLLAGEFRVTAKTVTLGDGGEERVAAEFAPTRAAHVRPGASDAESVAAVLAAEIGVLRRQLDDLRGTVLSR